MNKQNIISFTPYDWIWNIVLHQKQYVYVGRYGVIFSSSFASHPPPPLSLSSVCRNDYLKNSNQSSHFLITYSKPLWRGAFHLQSLHYPSGNSSFVHHHEKVIHVSSVFFFENQTGINFMVKYRTKAPLAFSEQHVSSRTVMYMRYKGSFLLQTVLAKGPHHNHQIFVGWHISWTSHHIYILIPHSSGTKLHTSFDSALSSCFLDNAKASIDLGCYWESPWLCH